MAIVNAGLQFLSGRVGDFVFYRRKGRNYIRIQPVKTKDPHTFSQLIQRQRMKDVVKMYQVIQSTSLCGIWKQLAQGKFQSAYNLFVKHNIRAFDGQGGIVFGRLHFSMGELPLPVDIRVERTEQKKVQILWQNPGILPREKMSDRLMVAVVFEDASLCWFGPETFTYCRKQQQAWLPLELQGRPYHLYCFFGSEDLKEFSDDVYLKVI